MALSGSTHQQPAAADLIDQAMARLDDEHRSGFGFTDDAPPSAADESDAECTEGFTRDFMNGRDSGYYDTRLSGDFDEWMKKHAPPQEEGDGNEAWSPKVEEEELADIQACWENARRQWSAEASEDQHDEPICIDVSDGSDDEDEPEYNQAESEYSQDGPEYNQAAAVAAMMSLCDAVAPPADSSPVEAAQDVHQRPPLPAIDTMPSIEQMSAAIYQSLENSVAMANQIYAGGQEAQAACTCDEAGSADENWQEGSGGEWSCLQRDYERQIAELNSKLRSLEDLQAAYDERESIIESQRQAAADQAEENQKLKGELSTANAEHATAAQQLFSVSAQCRSLRDKCATLELDAGTARMHLKRERATVADTQHELSIARSGSASEQERVRLQEQNQQLAQRIAELERSQSLSRSREGRLSSSNQLLQTQLTALQRQLDSSVTPTEMFLEQQRDRDAQLVQANKSTRHIQERLEAALSDLSNARSDNAQLKRQVRQLEDASEGADGQPKRRRVEASAPALSGLDDMVVNAGMCARLRRGGSCGRSPTGPVAAFQPTTPRINLGSNPLVTPARGSRPKRISMPHTAPPRRSHLELPRLELPRQGRRA